MSPVRATCVPPQNSRELPMSSTRTSSPYFSPNSIIAPDFFASLDRHHLGARRRVLQDLGVHALLDLADLLRRSSACRARSRSASCPRRPASPSAARAPPSTSRSALCIRCVTEWLRMVRRAQRGVDPRLDPVADLQRAGLRACRGGRSTSALDLLRVVDLEGAAASRPARRGRRPGRRPRRRTASRPAPRCRYRRSSARRRARPRDTAPRPWPHASGVS